MTTHNSHWRIQEIKKRHSRLTSLRPTDELLPLEYLTTPTEVALPALGMWSVGEACVATSDYMLSKLAELEERYPTPEFTPPTEEERALWRERSEQSRKTREAQEAQREAWRQEMERKTRGTKRFKSDVFRFLERNKLTNTSLMYPHLETIREFERLFVNTARAKKWDQSGYLGFTGGKILCGMLEAAIRVSFGIAPDLKYICEDEYEESFVMPHTFRCLGCDTEYKFKLYVANPYLIDALLDFAELHLYCAGQPHFHQMQLKLIRSHRPDNLPVFVHGHGGVNGRT